MNPPQPSIINTEPHPKSDYVSNPFINAIKGLIQVLRFDTGTSMLAALSFVPPFCLYYLLIWEIQKHPTFLGLLVIGNFFFWFLSIFLITGMWFAIAAASVKEQTISFSESVKLSLIKFLPLVCLSLMVGILSLVGFIVLIVPGVIIVARASLAPLVMFTENLGPIKALKRSIALTKGHSIEMIGSFFAGYLFSGGFLLAPAVTVAPFVGRYEDIKLLQLNNAKKPKTHWLNYLPIIVSIVLIGSVTVFDIATLSHTTNKPNNSISTRSQSTFTFTPHYGNSSLILPKVYGVIYYNDGCFCNNPYTDFYIYSHVNSNVIDANPEKYATIYIYNNFNGNLNNVVEKEKAQMKAQNLKVLQVSDTKINGIPAKLISASSSAKEYVFGIGKWEDLIILNGSKSKSLEDAILKGTTIKNNSIS